MCSFHIEFNKTEITHFSTNTLKYQRQDSHLPPEDPQCPRDNDNCWYQDVNHEVASNNWIFYFTWRLCYHIVVYWLNSQTVHKQKTNIYKQILKNSYQIISFNYKNLELCQFLSLVNMGHNFCVTCNLFKLLTFRKMTVWKYVDLYKNHIKYANHHTKYTKSTEGLKYYACDHNSYTPPRTSGLVDHP